MAGESVPEGPDLKEMGEEELWELINDNRHRLSLGVRPCIVIPYLRQARVLTEMDEDEILSSHNLTNRSMRTSHMMDLLRTQGRNGAVALLESLMIHYPTLYTQVTGRKPSSEPSRFSGLLFKCLLLPNEFKFPYVLFAEIQQIMEHEEKSRCLQLEYERVHRHLSSLQREVTQLKDEKCDLYVRYTAAIEEKSAVSMRLHDLNLQVGSQRQLKQLTLDCNMYQQKSTVIQNQMRELQTERDQVRLFQDTNAVPPFLVRSRAKALRIIGRIVTIAFQGETLLNQIAVVGGNKTGVFVHEVTEGSAAHTVGITQGAQIVEVRYKQDEKALKMVLEDSTLEEALWALGQVTGPCHLSLRPRPDDYEALLQQLQESEMSSGDSFYVRVNVTIPAGPKGTLTVSCNDILHVTNTRPADTQDSWYVSKVHPCQLLALHSGLVPNYYRISCLKTLYILSQLDETSPPRSCLTLMPYTPVTPHFPPICRPVLLLPSILGRILDKKVAAWQGFELCEPGKRNSLHTFDIFFNASIKDGRFLTQHQRGIHCVLPLGLDCVRRLHRAEIFPIIIFVGQSARSARKLRSKLHRLNWSEEHLLECSRSEETLLDKLPCLYHRVAPDSWCDQTSLLTRLRTVIWEEQRKIVWVEPDLW
uniref:Caspase recruitment domain family, member 14 n=1 Tax=Hippocampus comes TaxID=109280 RepID=A0A3Q2XZZ1_HIPCM